MLFGKFVPDCVRSNLRGSKFKIFLGGPQTPLVATHAYARYHHPGTIDLVSFPQLKIVYETLRIPESVRSDNGCQYSLQEFASLISRLSLRKERAWYILSHT